MTDTEKSGKMEELKSKTIAMLFKYAEHESIHAPEVNTIVHHIVCGDAHVFTKKGLQLLRREMCDNFDPYFPQDVRKEIIEFLDECGELAPSGRKAPRDRGNDSPIARARMAAGMTQVQLAGAMGCLQKDISRWERGLCNPGVDNLLKMADALGCSIMDLIGR